MVRPRAACTLGRMRSSGTGTALTALTIAAMVVTACSPADDTDDAGSAPSLSSPSKHTPTSGTSTRPSTEATPPDQPTLPNGARTVLPEHRLVGFAGGRSPSFGRLSIDDLDRAAAQMSNVARRYEDGRTILPVFELITVIAHASPGSDGMYRTVEPDEVVRQYLDAAREHDALLLLNIQPGRADFVDELRRLEQWLREPDVGVALDPEWAVGADEVPGEVYGSTTGTELDAAAAYLSAVVREHSLPEKVMVFHQVHSSVVQDEDALRPHDGVVAIKSIDGIGARSDKVETWRTLMRTKPEYVHPGFKLFFDEDSQHGRLMTPQQVLALQPTPAYVLYE